SFALVSYRPPVSVLPQPQYFSAIPQTLGRKVIQRVHFVSSRSEKFEAGCGELASKGPHVGDAKFDFNFLDGRHGENCSGFERQWHPASVTSHSGTSHQTHS